MSRAIPLLAVLCTGVALGALVVAMIGGANRAAPDLIEEVAPLDPTAALPEIAQLRESRGSILAGSSLAAGDDSMAFTAALATQSGAEMTSSEPETLVGQLRRTAQEYDEQARSLEEKQDYVQADQLRHLADEARQVARTLDAGNNSHQR
jgi:hypothetical protein